MTADPGSRPPGRTFPRDVLAGDTLAAARALLGARLVRDPELGAGERRVGRIVEVEAYIGEADLASHARFGRTARNAAMFGAPGVAYVYLVYGMYHCLNVVTEPAHRPAAVLVRAVEPVEGTDAMRRARIAFAARRRRAAGGADEEAARLARAPADRLAAGPGLVAVAFDIDRRHTGIDLCEPAARLRLEPASPGDAAPVVRATPRIGIAYAGEPWASVPWRFIVPGSPALSGPAGAR